MPLNTLKLEEAPRTLESASKACIFCGGSNVGTLISGTNQEPPDVAAIIDAQSILDAMPFYVLLVDSHHNIVGANKAFYRKMNLELPDVIRSYCPQLVHGIGPSLPGCPLEEAVATKEPGPSRTGSIESCEGSLDEICYLPHRSGNH